MPRLQQIGPQRFLMFARGSFVAAVININVDVNVSVIALPFPPSAEIETDDSFRIGPYLLCRCTFLEGFAILLNGFQRPSRCEYDEFFPISSPQHSLFPRRAPSSFFCLTETTHRYGMFNHMVYDVFIKNEDDFQDEETKLRGMSRFGDNLDEFNAKGLEFRYVRTTLPVIYS